MSYAFLCEKCERRAQWRVMRRGDVITTWACNEHLARACLSLQRLHEKTELVVTMNEHHPSRPVTTGAQ
jgi:hypothetical protein